MALLIITSALITYGFNISLSFIIIASSTSLAYPDLSSKSSSENSI